MNGLYLFSAVSGLTLKAHTLAIGGHWGSSICPRTHPHVDFTAGIQATRTTVEGRLHSVTATLEVRAPCCYDLKEYEQRTLTPWQFKQCIVPFIPASAVYCHDFLRSDLKWVKSGFLHSLPVSSLFSGLLRAGPLNLSSQFKGTKANKSHCPFGNFGLFAAFHDFFFRHLSASAHSGCPGKSMVPYILVWQLRRIHTNPFNLAFLQRAATGREGPQR